MKRAIIIIFCLWLGTTYLVIRTEHEARVRKADCRASCISDRVATLVIPFGSFALEHRGDIMVVDGPRLPVPKELQ